MSKRRAPACIKGMKLMLIFKFSCNDFILRIRCKVKKTTTRSDLYLSGKVGCYNKESRQCMYYL